MNKEQLEKIIIGQLKIPNLTPMMKSQIVKFKKSGLSYKDIGRSIFYYVNVLGRQPDREELKKYGIGIVPNLIDEANEYFEEKKKEQAFYRLQGRRLREAKQKRRKRIKAKPQRKPKPKGYIDIEKL